MIIRASPDTVVPQMNRGDGVNPSVATASAIESTITLSNPQRKASVFRLDVDPWIEICLTEMPAPTMDRRQLIPGIHNQRVTIQQYFNPALAQVDRHFKHGVHSFSLAEEDLKVCASDLRQLLPLIVCKHTKRALFGLLRRINTRAASVHSKDPIFCSLYRTALDSNPSLISTKGWKDITEKWIETFQKTGTYECYPSDPRTNNNNNTSTSSSQSTLIANVRISQPTSTVQFFVSSRSRPTPRSILRTPPPPPPLPPSYSFWKGPRSSEKPHLYESSYAILNPYLRVNLTGKPLWTKTISNPHGKWLHVEIPSMGKSLPRGVGGTGGIEEEGESIVDDVWVRRLCLVYVCTANRCIKNLPSVRLELTDGGTSNRFHGKVYKSFYRLPEASSSSSNGDNITRHQTYTKSSETPFLLFDIHELDLKKNHRKKPAILSLHNEHVGVVQIRYYDYCKQRLYSNIANHIRPKPCSSPTPSDHGSCLKMESHKDTSISPSLVDIPSPFDLLDLMDMNPEPSRDHGCPSQSSTGTTTTKDPTGSQMDQEDQEIETGAQTVSLLCPLGMTRIQIPVCGKQCKHAACFDLDNFMHCAITTIGRPVEKWSCPVCGLDVFPGDLVGDALMQEVLNHGRRSVRTSPSPSSFGGEEMEEEEESFDMIRLFPDGSWVPISEEYLAQEAKHHKRMMEKRLLYNDQAKGPSLGNVVIEISDDDEE